jgi:hypothetical protein
MMRWLRTALIAVVGTALASGFGVARAQAQTTIPTKIINPKGVPYPITHCSVVLEHTPLTATLQFSIRMEHARFPGGLSDTTIGEVTFVYSSGQTASRLISPLNPTMPSFISLSSYGMSVTHARCALAFYNDPLTAVGVPEYLAPWISPDWNASLPLPPIPFQ